MSLIESFRSGTSSVKAVDVEHIHRWHDYLREIAPSRLTASLQKAVESALEGFRATSHAKVQKSSEQLAAYIEQEFGYGPGPTKLLGAVTNWALLNTSAADLVAVCGYRDVVADSALTNLLIRHADNQVDVDRNRALVTLAANVFSPDAVLFDSSAACAYLDTLPALAMATESERSVVRRCVALDNAIASNPEMWGENPRLTSLVHRRVLDYARALDKDILRDVAASVHQDVADQLLMTASRFLSPLESQEKRVHFVDEVQTKLAETRARSSTGLDQSKKASEDVFEFGM